MSETKISKNGSEYDASKWPSEIKGCRIEKNISLNIIFECLQIARVEYQNQLTQNNTHNEDAMKSLEESLLLCKFGKFHIKLLAASLCSTFATMMIATTSSYILPVAECDLDMNIMYKGLLNAMPYMGQVAASLLTGFLIDAFGRKIFLVGGNAATFVCSIIEGSSQNYWMLICIKLLQGIAVSFSYNAVTTNISEFCHQNIRNRILMISAGFLSLSLIVTALVSWVILPRKIDVVIFEGYFQLHAWNIYLYICSVWSFFATILFYYLPESPKFLLAHGQTKEALEVIRTIYYENTGKAKETLPITSLNLSYKVESITELSLRKKMLNALNEVKDLFRMPFLCNLFLFAFICFSALISYASLRLWFPQISTIVENYQRTNGETAQFCFMIDSYMKNLDKKQLNVTLSLNEPHLCIPKTSDSEPYINGVILGFFSILFVALNCYLVKYVSEKILIFFLLILCSVTSAAMYWTYTSIQIAILVSCTCALIQTIFGLLQNIFIQVFPTTLRALAVSIIIMFSRLGSLVGSIIFPVLLELGCMAPILFTTISSLCLAGLIYFLPNVNIENFDDRDN